MKVPRSFLILAPTLLLACGEAPPAADVLAAPVVLAPPAPVERVHRMPTPNELFEIVRGMAGEGAKRLMNPAARADRYVTLQARALNFGVYATDMVYASTFRLGGEVPRYYLTCKDLSEALGLNTVFNDSDFVQLERHVARGEALEQISNDAYYRAYRRMQEEQMGPVLALVLAGGWVESMHLVMAQVERFDPNDPLSMRVGEQKASLEQLIGLMEGSGDDPLVTPIRVRLMEVLAIYDELNVRRNLHPDPSPSGRMVLGDDVTVSMTPEKFSALQEAIEDLRDTITRPEDAPPARNGR